MPNGEPMVTSGIAYESPLLWLPVLQWLGANICMWIWDRKGALFYCCYRSLSEVKYLFTVHMYVHLFKNLIVDAKYFYSFPFFWCKWQWRNIIPSKAIESTYYFSHKTIRWCHLPSVKFFLQWRAVFVILHCNIISLSKSDAISPYLLRHLYVFDVGLSTGSRGEELLQSQVASYWPATDILSG